MKIYILPVSISAFHALWRCVEWSEGTITSSSQRSSDEGSRSDRISASEVVELLDNTDGDIDSTSASYTPLLYVSFLVRYS